MSEKVTGYIDHVIFRNDENGYTVMVLKTADSEEELTCVGTFPDVTQGVTISSLMRKRHQRTPRLWNVIWVPERLKG